MKQPEIRSTLPLTALDVPVYSTSKFSIDTCRAAENAMPYGELDPNTSFEPAPKVPLKGAAARITMRRVESVDHPAEVEIGT
jgi:hypothetical protein